MYVYHMHVWQEAGCHLVPYLMTYKISQASLADGWAQRDDPPYYEQERKAMSHDQSYLGLTGHL